ncbi:MAG: sll1863 family stress response protein [Hyphococcus sp.]
MANQHAYQEKFEAKLKEADAQIDKLAAQAEAAQADVKIQYQEHLKSLRERRDEMNQNIARFSKASEDAAKDMRKGLEDAWDALSDSLKSAQSKFQ